MWFSALETIGLNLSEAVQHQNENVKISLYKDVVPTGKKGAWEGGGVD